MIWLVELPPSVRCVAVESRWLRKPHVSPHAKRRAELHLGRHCARRALAELGSLERHVGADAHGDPSWPTGLVGSITHCDGLAAAAVAWTREVAALGIDTEPLRVDVEGLVDAVGAEDEIAALARAVDDTARAVTLLASAKESVFKALYPGVRRWFDFRAVELVLERGELVGRVVEDLGAAWPIGAGVRVRFAFDDARVYTTCIVPGSRGFT